MMTYVDDLYFGGSAKRDSSGGLYSVDGQEFIRMTDKEVVSYSIAPGTKTVKSGAFKDCDKLLEVTLPDGIKRLGDMIFSGCDSLNSITLPSSLKKLLNNPFGTMLQIDCKSDKFKFEENALFSADGTTLFALMDNVSESYSVREGVKRLAGAALSGCASLRKVELPDTLCEIGEDVFLGCSSLEEVIIGKNLSFPSLKIDPWTALLHPEQTYDNSGGDILMIDRELGTASVCDHKIIVRQRAKGRLSASIPSQKSPK